MQRHWAAAAFRVSSMSSVELSSVRLALVVQSMIPLERPKSLLFLLFSLLKSSLDPRRKQKRNRNASLCAEADKLGPRLDLGGYPALGIRPQAALRDLFRERLDEQERRARVVQQRQPKVDRVPTRPSHKREYDTTAKYNITHRRAT